MRQKETMPSRVPKSKWYVDGVIKIMAFRVVSLPI